MKERPDANERVAVIAVSGRLDGKRCGDLERELKQLLDRGRKHIALNLEKLEYISSAGLRVLLSAAKTLSQTEGTIKLAHLQPQVKDVFDLTGLTDLFEISPDIEQCLQSFQP